MHQHAFEEQTPPTRGKLLEFSHRFASPLRSLLLPPVISRPANSIPPPLPAAIEEQLADQHVLEEQ